jgi:hypothetical protein
MLLAALVLVVGAAQALPLGFVAWLQARPQHENDGAIDALFRYASEAFPLRAMNAVASSSNLPRGQASAPPPAPGN